MTASVESLFEQAKALAPGDRYELIDRLQDLEVRIGPDISSTAGIAELKRRMDDFDSGREPGIPAEVVYAKARRKLEERHAACEVPRPG